VTQRSHRDVGFSLVGSDGEMYCVSRTSIMQATSREQVRRVCEEVLAPLVHADGGEIFLVSLEADSVEIHLAGTCAGCPGATLTARAVIEPAILAVAPGMRIKVTSGFHVPDGANELGRAPAA
jgi:Fe-S cluster biogenesis protein NfuA